jgi:hypothetical protein
MLKKITTLIFFTFSLLISPDKGHSAPFPTPVEGLYTEAVRALNKAATTKILWLTGKPVIDKTILSQFLLTMAGVQTGLTLSRLDQETIIALTQDRFQYPLNSSNYLMSMVDLLTDPYSKTIRLRGPNTELRFLSLNEAQERYGVLLKRELWPTIESMQHFQTTLWRNVEFDPLNRKVIDIKGGSRFSSQEAKLDGLIDKFEAISENTTNLLQSDKLQKVLRTIITQNYRQQTATKGMRPDVVGREIEMELRKALRDNELATRLVRRAIFQRTLLNSATFEELRIQQEFFFLHELIDQEELVFGEIFKKPENVLAFLDSIHQTLQFMLRISPYKNPGIENAELTDYQKRLSLQQISTLLQVLGLKVQIPSPAFNGDVPQTLIDLEAQIEVLISHYEESLTHQSVAHVYPVTNVLNETVFGLWQTMQRLRVGYSIPLDSGPSDTWVDTMTPREAATQDDVMGAVYNYFGNRRDQRDLQYTLPPGNGYISTNGNP